MAQTASAVLSESSAVDHEWIAAELSKGIDAERAFAAESKARGDSPPDPCLGVLYHEIAAADDRHAATIERVATRYGHTPGLSAGTGIGDALGQIKDRLTKLGSSPLDQLSADLQAKARSVHWLTAWSQAFEKIGDHTSSSELAAVLKDEEAHHAALQQSLNRMVEQHARGEVTP